MNWKRVFASGVAATVMGGALMESIPAIAQDSLSRASHHRQKKKNEWRNLAIGAGAVGIYGLAKGDTGLAAAGLAGAAYSGHRYEQDRKSQSRIDRARRARYYRRHHRRHRR